MSSNTVDIPDQNAENCPPSESTSCTNGLSTSTPPSIKPNSYMKGRGRRRKWWYFNRGLQPISELAEIKDDAIKSENRDASLLCPDNSFVVNNDIPTDNTIISTESSQNKESYSACLKLIEKFQEVVMDSAVRVIQAAFKRFRERRRFLRIKRAVMVIQRNLRKWLETKHPCIRPADFERQTSDGAKSDEYRETIENMPKDHATEEKDYQLNNNESENSKENDTNGKENLVESNTLDNLQESMLDVEDVNTELECSDTTLNVESKCEETIKSNSSGKEKLIVTSAESEHEEIVRDVKLLLEEMLIKVTSNYSDSNLHENEPEESKNLTTLTDTTDIYPSLKLISENNIETQGKYPLNKPNIDGMQEDLNLEKDSYSKTTAGDDFKDKEEHASIMLKISPDSLKGICQKFFNVSEISNPQNKKDAES